MRLRWWGSTARLPSHVQAYKTQSALLYSCLLHTPAWSRYVTDSMRPHFVLIKLCHCNSCTARRAGGGLSGEAHKIHLHLHLPDFPSRPSKLGKNILVSAQVGCEKWRFSSESRSPKTFAEDVSTAPTATPAPRLPSHRASSGWEHSMASAEQEGLNQDGWLTEMIKPD